jgi:serine protease Do
MMRAATFWRALATLAVRRGGFRARCAVAVLAAGLQVGSAQTASSQEATLPRASFRNGDGTLRAFASVAALTRNSIVKLNVDGETVALGTVVSTNGLTLTKASELKPGALTAWLASGEQVNAELLGTDEDHDVALVRVHQPRLKPVVWATAEVALGQWAITPGVVDTPHAVGIVSAQPRRIRPPRAFMGVVFDLSAAVPTLSDVRPGWGAEAAGLKAGDVILAVNDIAITNREQATEIIRECRDGQTVNLRYRRGEQESSAAVRVRVPGPNESDSLFVSPERTTRLAGAVSSRADGFDSVIQHDTVLQPWLCGGPLVNLDGQAIGLNIARAGRVATYALPARVVKQILQTLLPQNAQPAKRGG